MKRISMRDLSFLFFIILGLALAIGLVIRAVSISSRTSEIEKAQQEDKSVSEAYTAKLLLLHAAQGEENDRAAYMKQLRAALALPEFSSKNLEAVLYTADRIKDVHQDAIASLAVEGVKSHVFGEYEDLVAIAKNPLFPSVVALNKEFPLTEMLLGTKTIPDPASPPHVDIPSPLAHMSTQFWLILWGIASTIFYVLYFIIFESDLEKDETLFSVYPWQRPVAWTYIVATAPMTTIVAVIYGVSRVFKTEWNLPGMKRRLRTFAYQHRLIRRLPAPVLRPVHVPTRGQVTETATVEPLRPQELVERITRLIAEPLDVPKWYVVTDQICLGLQHALDEAGIKLYRLAIKQPSDILGYAIPAASIETFERTLHITDASRTDTDTDIESTVLRRYKRFYIDPDIVDFTQASIDILGQVLRSVASYSRAAIHCQNYEGKSVEPAPEDNLVHIMYNATPSKSVIVETVERTLTRVFGHEVTGVTILAPDLFRGGKLLKDEDGNDVVQVLDGTIYLLVHGLLGIAREKAWPIDALARTFHKAVAIAREQQTAKKDDAARAEAWRNDLEQHKQRYIQLSSRRFDEARDKLAEDIATYEKDIVDTGVALTGALKKKRHAETQRRAMIEHEAAQSGEHLSKEFDQLAAAACVTSVVCTKDSVDVRTRTVYITHEEKRYEIGRFLIRLFDDGKINIVNIANTAKGTDRHHPHIYADGQSCFGNLQEALSKLMAERQYAVVVSMLFRHLEGYHFHRGVEPITHWLEVT